VAVAFFAKMADTENPDFDSTPADDSSNDNFEEALREQLAQLPPNLFEAMQPLLVLGSLANYMLMGYQEDPVPQALTELLGYDIDALQTMSNAHDNASLGRVMAMHSLQLFDFVQIARLVFESRLDAPLRAYMGRFSNTEDGFAGPREFMLTSGEELLENIGQHLAGTDDDLREELRMRRLQTDSIFARLDDTLRPYYPEGNSPADDEARALDEADEAEDFEEAAVHVNFNAAQRLTLTTALRLPFLLSDMGETPFARALAGVRRFRRKALERLANRLTDAEDDAPLSLAWSELLRLYQAAQVCALSTVANVAATGSLEDLMLQRDVTDAAVLDKQAAQARHTRQLMTEMMTGFVATIEQHHPDDEDVAEAKAEISRLAELLME
jgi:hypothetical protein